MLRPFGFLGLTILAVTIVACSDGSDSPAPIVGVNDVGKACTIRASWTKLTTQTCSNCIGGASVPKCACSHDEFSGKCSEQKTATYHEPTCSGTGECVEHCNQGDCACVEACYANRDVCRTRASALDGCLAEVCNSYCR